MKKYKLLKDLPGWSAGTTCEYDEDEKCVLMPDSYPGIFFNPDVFPEWFEEIKEGSRQPCEDCVSLRKEGYSEKTFCSRGCAAKEENKHENIHSECSNCGATYGHYLSCAIEEQTKKEQIKPSQWIEGWRKAHEYTDNMLPVKPPIEEGILAFLDEHFSK